VAGLASASGGRAFDTCLVVDVRIRPAAAGDKAFILDLAQRLIEFGAVAAREPHQMVERDRAVLAHVLENATPDAELFVAVDESNSPLGFIHLTTDHDYYSDRVTAHIGDIVVASGMDRQGIGSALMAFAEEWARGRGFSLLTLNVFGANHGARALYDKLGFQEEWIRCIKRL
jgi:ribosomal protein S18 acetylase RimI-like enzyme